MRSGRGMHPAWRAVLLTYFVTHVPATLILDLQGLALELFPPALQNMHGLYVATFKDPLMGERPLWFRSLLSCEAVFQLPFFFAAIYALYKRDNRIRIPMIVYCSHVVTTMVPILAVLGTHESLSVHERATLLSFYLPYLLVPLAAGLHFALVPRPFGEPGATGRAPRPKAA